MVAAQENARTVALERTILFYGMVQDSSFAPGEKLNVEILETGEAIQTVVGENFFVKLPEDTLWNVCVTNSDTSGAEKEKCYELVYHGQDSVFSMALGDSAVIASEALRDSATCCSSQVIPSEDLRDSATCCSSQVILSEDLRDSATCCSSQVILSEEKESDVNVDDLLAASNSRVTEMKKVVVQLRRRPKRKAGESVVTAKSIKRMPGLAEADVIRSIQALPGVVASSDFSTKIYVRGGAADQNLFLYDNSVVYSPTHFFGLFSTFLVETIDEVQFYKSGFPAQYGNRLSSVLKMDGRAGGSDSVEEWLSKTSVKISTFAAQLHTEGHMGNARWVVAARQTYIGYMLALLRWLDAVDLDVDYEFTDIQGTFLYDFDPDNRLKFSFYVGWDKLAFDPLYVDWGNVAIPINYFHRDGNWEYNATLAFSRFYQTMQVSDMIDIGMDLFTYAGKQWINYKGFDDHTLTFGYDLEYDQSEFYEHAMSVKLVDHQYPFHHVGYLQDAWRLAADWTLTYGVRLNYQTLAEHFGVEPRASLVWQMTDRQRFELYGGRYLQYMNSIMFSDQESLNEFYYPIVTTSDGRHMKPASSYLFALEYSHRDFIFNGYNFTAGAYYKTQKDLKTFTMAQDSTDETTSDDFVMADYFGTARGYSFGYELSLRKDEGSWFGGINWSQSVSVVRSDDGTDAYYPNWHQPYALKMDAGLNWRGKDGMFAPNAKTYFRSSIILKYSAGMPMTNYVGYFYEDRVDPQVYSDAIQVVPGGRNEGRQSDYFRIDVKVVDWGKENKWNFSWTIINLTDHENLFYSFYDTSENPPKKTNIYQFPYLPVMLNYEYYF